MSLPLTAAVSICSEFPGSEAMGRSRPDKTAESDETAIAKSPSDYGLVGRRTVAGNTRRTQSHSGGNPPAVGSKKHPLSPVACEFTDLHGGVDVLMFDVIVSLVDTLLTLDCRIDTWRSVMSSSWRRVVDVGRSRKQRHCLKSTLVIFTQCFDFCSVVSTARWTSAT